MSLDEELFVVLLVVRVLFVAVDFTDESPLLFVADKTDDKLSSFAFFATRTLPSFSGVVLAPVVLVAEDMDSESKSCSFRANALAMSLVTVVLTLNESAKLFVLVLLPAVFC